MPISFEAELYEGQSAMNVFSWYVKWHTEFKKKNKKQKTKKKQRKDL